MSELQVNTLNAVEMNIQEGPTARIVNAVSPTATVSKTGTVTTITITDKNGTTTEEVNDGATGATGATGANGTNAYVHIKYSEDEPTQDSDMKDIPDAWIGVYSGDASSAPTAYTSYTWYKIKGPTGDTGPTGPVAAFSIGTVTTGDAGTDAAATITGTDAAPVLNLTIPKGAKGDAGNGDMLAPAFAEATANDAGTYVTYDGGLYLLPNGHTANETWANTTKISVTVGGETSDLKSAMTELDDGKFVVDKNIAWTNAYVNASGKLVASSASKTGLFEMESGETLTVGTLNPNITIIGSTTSDSIAVGDTITVIQRTSSTSQYEEYSYTATETIKIVVCVLAANYNLTVTRKSAIQTQIDTANGNIAGLQDSIDDTNAAIEVLDSKCVKLKTTTNTGTAESVWETNAVDMSDGGEYYAVLLSVSGVNVSTNPYMAVRIVYSDSTQTVTPIDTLGELVKINTDSGKTYVRTNVVCYRADGTAESSVASSWQYAVFKGTPNKTVIDGLSADMDVVKDYGWRYTHTFDSSGSGHSASNDMMEITISHNQSFTIKAALNITPSGTYECYARYADNTSQKLYTGYFGREYSVTPPKNVARLGFSVGAQSGAYSATITVNTDGSTGIVELNEDAHNDLTQAKRTINLTTNAYLSNTQPLVLLHFSDVHGADENLRRIVAFKDQYADLIDDTICTGDMVRDRYSNGMGFWDAVPGAEDILTVVGNHDALAAASGYDWTDLASQADQYSQYMSPYISGWDCQYTANLTYYYKDYDAKKVRLICLNCMLSGDDDSAQLTWFGNTLSGAIEKDFYVIVAVHYPISNHTTVSCGFSSIDKTPYQTQDRLSDDYMSAVNTFIGNGGKFGCYITGHTHTDFILKSSNYAGQLCVVIDAASMSAANVDSDTQRTMCMKSYDCANLFVFDSASGAIKIIRVGADMDHYLRSKNCITFKQSDLSIIAES